MSSINFRLLAAAGAALLASACQGVPEAEELVTPDASAATKPVTEAVLASDERSATVTIGFMPNQPNGTLGFTMACSGATQGISGSGGCSMLTGDLDLSSYGPGDMPITVNIDVAAAQLGWRFVSDPYQGVAVSIDPPGVTQAPPPQFGQSNWPSTFAAPVVNSSTSLTFIDDDDDANAYEYSIQVTGYAGPVILDPQIKNGGENK